MREVEAPRRGGVVMGAAVCGGMLGEVGGPL